MIAVWNLKGILPQKRDDRYPNLDFLSRCACNASLDGLRAAFHMWHWVADDKGGVSNADGHSMEYLDPYHIAEFLGTQDSISDLSMGCVGVKRNEGDNYFFALEVHDARTLTASIEPRRFDRATAHVSLF